MNITTLVFLGLAVVWAIVLLPEAVRKLAGTRNSDTIRSFNHQLSVLNRSEGRSAAGRSNVIDLRSRRSDADRPAAAPPVPMSVRKRRQEVLTVLGAAAVLTLLCTVAFGSIFLVLHLLADVLLVTYVVLVNQANQAAAARAGSFTADPVRRSDPGRGMARTATVGRTTPVPRRIAN
jgi:hypothetical protein